MNTTPMIYSEMYLDLMVFFFPTLFTYLTCFCYSIFGGNICLTASQLDRIKALLKWKLFKSKLLSSQIFILCVRSQKGVQKTFSVWGVRWTGHHDIGLVSFSETLSAGGCIKSFCVESRCCPLEQEFICKVLSWNARCHFLSTVLFILKEFSPNLML